MTQTDAAKLIDIAKKGEHKEVNPIETYSGFLAAKTASKAMTKLINRFGKIKNNFFKTYKLELKANHLDKSFAALLWMRDMNTCQEYYKIELDNVDQQIEKYRDYLTHPEDFNFGGNSSGEELN